MPPTIRFRAGMTPLFGILNNANHGWMTQARGFVAGHARPTSYGGARSFGAWADGPMNPYRHEGHTYFQVPHSENYRIKIPNHYWGDPKAWIMENDAMPSSRRAEEHYYDNRHWIFSVRNVNGTLYALTHHEWYKDRVTISNVQGFLVEGKPWGLLHRVGQVDQWGAHVADDADHGWFKAPGAGAPAEQPGASRRWMVWVCPPLESGVGREVSAILCLCLKYQPRPE